MSMRGVRELIKWIHVLLTVTVTVIAHSRQGNYKEGESLHSNAIGRTNLAVPQRLLFRDLKWNNNPKLSENYWLQVYTCMYLEISEKCLKIVCFVSMNCLNFIRENDMVAWRSWILFSVVKSMFLPFENIFKIFASLWNILYANVMYCVFLTPMLSSVSQMPLGTVPFYII